METDASSLFRTSTTSCRVAFWTGLVSVMLFSLSRFNVTLPDIDELSPPLRPRSFTTAFRFWLAAFVYIGCYASLYLALLAVGSVPQLREVLSRLLRHAGHSNDRNSGMGRFGGNCCSAGATLDQLHRRLDQS